MYLWYSPIKYVQTGGQWGEHNDFNNLLISLILPYTMSKHSQIWGWRTWLIQFLGKGFKPVYSLLFCTIAVCFWQTEKDAVMQPSYEIQIYCSFTARATDSLVVLLFHLDHLYFSSVSLDILKNHSKYLPK